MSDDTSLSTDDVVFWDTQSVEASNNNVADTPSFWDTLYSGVQAAGVTVAAGVGSGLEQVATAQTQAAIQHLTPTQQITHAANQVGTAIKRSPISTSMIVIVIVIIAYFFFVRKKG